MALTGIWQDQIGRPSRCTVHAPHCAMPHPNFVPVMPSTSRNTHNSGMLSGTSTVFVSTLIFNCRCDICGSRGEWLDCTPACRFQHQREADTTAVRRMYY